MHKAINYCLNLNESSIAFLKTIEQQMGIVADLSRADILLFGRKSGDKSVIVAHAQPRSIARVYSTSREGRIIGIDKRPEVLYALISGQSQKEERSFITEGAPVIRKVYPVFYPPPYGKGWVKEKAQVVAAFCVVTNLIEYERHRRRSKVFRNAVEQLHGMVLRGQLIGSEVLTPFGEQDGIMLTNSEGIICYASGIAANLYRRLGYKETLLGRRLSQLETADEEIRQAAWEHGRCFEQECQEANRFWIRKAIPLATYPHPFWSWLEIMNIPIEPEKKVGVLITLHDATETRRQNQEIQVKNAMIQEIHHRVKNNLQTIAGLLRMQARRVKSEEAKTALDEALNRILSIAVIHEFLSNESSNIINIKEVSHRIATQLQQGMLSSDTGIKLLVTGEPIFLPSRQATVCSLIINELLQNGLEHGFIRTKKGQIEVNLQDGGDEVIITVSDNGDGLTEDFETTQSHSLGLQIVKILVEGDLRGKIQLNSGTGLSIKISFPKILFEGEKGWKEHVSL